MSASVYWQIFAAEVPSDMGLVLTTEQQAQLADAIEGAVENQSTAMGWDHIPNPDRAEIERLERQVRELRAEIARIDEIWAGPFGYISGVSANKIYRDGERIRVSA